MGTVTADAEISLFRDCRETEDICCGGYLKKGVLLEVGMVDWDSPKTDEAPVPIEKPDSKD